VLRLLRGLRGLLWLLRLLLWLLRMRLLLLLLLLRLGGRLRLRGLLRPRRRLHRALSAVCRSRRLVALGGRRSGAIRGAPGAGVRRRPSLRRPAPRRPLPPPPSLLRRVLREHLQQRLALRVCLRRRRGWGLAGPAARGGLAAEAFKGLLLLFGEGNDARDDPVLAARCFGWEGG
jgi:hypothetical protein